MLNFFSGLVNVVGVPVILAGTPKAVGVLTQEFRHARRGTGQGDMIWERMLRDTDTGEAEWELFVRAMWRYQYTREVTPLTPKLSNALYDESQGITDVTVKLYMLAQLRAIQTGTERITVGLIRSVAKDSLRSISAVLNALKEGKGGRAFLATLDDILAEGLVTIVADGTRATERLPGGVEPSPTPPAAEAASAPPQEPPTPPSAPPRTPRARRSKSTAPAGTLMEIVASGKSSGLLAYDALRQAGLIAEDAVAA